MTVEDIEILLKYLRKATVPMADHEPFIRAFEHLESLIYQRKQVA